MSKLFLIIFLILTSKAFGQVDVINSQVINISPSNNPQTLMVFISAIDRVMWIDKKEVRTLYDAFKENRLVRVTFEKDSYKIVKVEELPKAKSLKEEDFYLEDPVTIDPLERLTSEEATSKFRVLLKHIFSRRAQCYQRAHYWSFYLDRKYQTHVYKYFLFFTPKYISRCNYKWWFHVTPILGLKEQMTSFDEVVIDRTFISSSGANTPISPKEWIKKFVNSNNHRCSIQPSEQDCPIMEMSEYQAVSQNRDNRLCYIIKTPRFYMQPMDINNYAKDHTQTKKRWRRGDLYLTKKGIRKWRHKRKFQELINNL